LPAVNHKANLAVLLFKAGQNKKRVKRRLEKEVVDERRGFGYCLEREIASLKGIVWQRMRLISILAR